MIKIIKKIAYCPPVNGIFQLIFSLVYGKQYLSGKYFNEFKIGYWWCLRGIGRRIALSRQDVKWPCGKRTDILNGKNIQFDNSSLNVFQQPGCYYQGFDKIYIGKNVWIAPNVGIITANHDLTDPDKHSEGKPVIISDRCWIGMNSVILPGVILGENTVVGAGSIVTKSFPDGYCVIAGNPARLIKRIDD